MDEDPEFAARFLGGLGAVIERAWRSGDWGPAAKAFQAGLADSRTRAWAFSCLAEIVMRRLFILREPEEKLGRFLRDELRVTADMVQPLERIAVDAAAKALRVSKSEISLQEAAEGLSRDHGADLPLATAVLETAVRFVERYRFSWSRLAFALLSVLGHPVVSVPLTLALGALVLFAARAPWWLAVAIAAVAFLVLSAGRAVGAAALRGRERYGNPDARG